jgi:predicted nucleotidyltransferase
VAARRRAILTAPGLDPLSARGRAPSAASALPDVAVTDSSDEPQPVVRLKDMGAPSPTRFPTAAALRELVRCIVEVAKPERIILFGSAARGQMGPDSDLDVLVVKSAIEHRRRLAQDIYMNLPALGIGVDVIVLTPEDIEAQRTRVGSIVGPALEEGRVIYGA